LVDSARTLHKFYQYWLNTSDVDAEKYIKILLFLSKEEIEVLTEKHKEAPHLRLLQTFGRRNYGDGIQDDLENAIKASNILFGNSTLMI
jgi:tyrosyl-tRNA synthetase